MKLCPNRSAAEEHSLKRGLLPSHGRIRRGPEGSSRKVDVRRSWDPRVETTTGTPCLEEMPITNGRHHRLLPDNHVSEVTAERYHSNSMAKRSDNTGKAAKDSRLNFLSSQNYSLRTDHSMNKHDFRGHGSSAAFTAQRRDISIFVKRPFNLLGRSRWRGIRGGVRSGALTSRLPILQGTERPWAFS